MEWKLPFNIPDEVAERSFPEDYHLENGQYQCNCIFCGKLFYGHKRRVTCKKCQNAEQS
jgi:hypothetical protein